MAAAKNAGRFSAAAVTLGLALGAPLMPGTVAAALADTGDSGSSVSTDSSERRAGTSAARAGAPGAPDSRSDLGPRSPRLPKPPARGDADLVADEDVPADLGAPADQTAAPATRRPAVRGGGAPEGPLDKPTTRRPTTDLRVATDVPTAEATPAATDTPATPGAPVTKLPERAPEWTTPAATEPADTPADERIVPTDQTAAPTIGAPQPATGPLAVAAPRALATISKPVGAAATSFSGTLEDLFGPIQAFFEGVALLVRRTFFNEAPTLSPVQLTGFSEGPITGTLGAVDPEDDPLTFKVTGSPQYGTVTLTKAGEYTYMPGADFTGSDSFSVTATDGGFHINLLNPFRPAGTSASLSVAQGAQAPTLRFQFVYGSGAQLWSSDARLALESAARQLTSYLVVSAPTTITYAVTAEYSPLSSTLATASSDFASAGAGFLATVVQRKIQTGVDANGAAADGAISWNFGPSWGFGNTVSSSQYDFQSIAMHELAHTLGFLSATGAPGSNTGRTWTEYDGYLVTAAGAPVIGSDYAWNSAYNTNLTGGNGGLYFSGPNAVAAYGRRVPLYTPSTWAAGSSVSHLNDFVFTGANDTLMTARVTRGPAPRQLSAVELGILSDLGYTVAPGPGTATLMIVGVFLWRRPRRPQP